MKNAVSRFEFYFICAFISVLFFFSHCSLAGQTVALADEHTKFSDTYKDGISENLGKRVDSAFEAVEKLHVRTNGMFNDFDTKRYEEEIGNTLVKADGDIDEINKALDDLLKEVGVVYKSVNVFTGKDYNAFNNIIGKVNTIYDHVDIIDQQIKAMNIKLDELAGKISTMDNK